MNIKAGSIIIWTKLKNHGEVFEDLDQADYFYRHYENLDLEPIWQEIKPPTK